MAYETNRNPTADEIAGMQWWNSLTEAERANWLARADSAVPTEAWAANKCQGRLDLQPPGGNH